MPWKLYIPNYFPNPTINIVMSIGRLIAEDSEYLLFLSNQNILQIRVQLSQKSKSFDISKPYFQAGARARVNSAESLVWIYTFIWLYFKHNILL